LAREEIKFYNIDGRSENNSGFRNVALAVGAGALLFGGISATLKAEAEIKPISVELIGAR